MFNHFEVKKFLEGKKPALMITQRALERMTKEMLEKLAEYPCFRIPKKINGESIAILWYFQTEEQRDNFEKDWKQADNIICRTIVEGMYLGYPPKAVQWYANTSPLTVSNMQDTERLKERLKRFNNEKVCISYGALRFVCNRYDIEECVRWLWDNGMEEAEARIEKEIAYRIVTDSEGRKRKRTEYKCIGRIPFRDEEVLLNIARAQCLDWDIDTLS